MNIVAKTRGYIAVIIISLVLGMIVWCYYGKQIKRLDQQLPEDISTSI